MNTKTVTLKKTGVNKSVSILIKLALSLAFVAAGVLLPQGFHIFGSAAGKTFLPMHLPVLLAGFVLGPIYGCMVGVITPILSCLFTAMPQAPTVFFMIAELGVYGLCTGILSKGKAQGYFAALSRLAIALVCGKAVYAIALFVCGSLLQLNVPPAIGYISGISAGMPGMIIQIAVIPVAVAMLSKGGFLHERTTGNSKTNP